MKTNREDVVQAALIVERWCKINNPCAWPSKVCTKCPLFLTDDEGDLDCMVGFPMDWELEEKLRKRGLRGGESNAGTPGADSGAD